MVVKIHRTKTALILIGVLLSFQSFFLGGSALAKPNKDIILVLDTSMSMLGYAGGKDILIEVKKSIGNYIDKYCDDNDRVTFITFDSEVRIYPTVYVDDDNDREILKKYITMTQAKGLWTSTCDMLSSVFERGSQLEKVEKKYQVVIVIMTDGIDDPPPGVNRRCDIKTLKDKYGVKDSWWVYLLPFSDFKKSQAVKKLQSDIKPIVPKVKIIESKTPEEGIGTKLPSDVKKLEAEQESVIIPLMTAIAVIAFIVLLIMLVKRFAGMKVSGRLEYWNNEVLDPYIFQYDLKRRQMREVLIGKGVGCVIDIRDYNLKAPFLIRAERLSGAVRMKIITRGSVTIEMVNREAGHFLNDGDMFKAGNFTFKYHAE
jgi:hypothetical protein